MSFEKHILLIAEEVGIENAYFFEGTMFFSADNADTDSMNNFVEYAENALVNTKILYSNAGDEIAVDFVLESTFPVNNY